jgi:hypothetical protein
MDEVKMELWEADEYIITVRGKPVGCTLSQEAARRTAEWLRSALPELRTPPLPSQEQVGALIEAAKGAQHDSFCYQINGLVLPSRIEVCKCAVGRIAKALAPFQKRVEP